MPFGLPAVSAFLHGPPLLGKILENKEAREAGVRTGKGNQPGLARVGGEELVLADDKFQVMVVGKASGSLLRVLASGRPLSLLLRLFGRGQLWVECSPFS